MSVRFGDILVASNVVTGDTLPIGAVQQWYSDTIPDNWLLANGQAVSRTTYSELFTLWGTAFGVGDNSTTFNVIDMRDYVPVGKSATDTNINAIGKKYGSKFTEAHVHSMADIYGYTGVAAGVSTTAIYQNGSLVTKNTGNFGTGNAGNMQPSIATNFIIKAKQSSGVVATVVDGFGSDSTTNASSAKNAKVLASGTLKSKIITATRDAGGANGDVSYTGVGFTPTSIQVLMCVNGTVYSSECFGDSTKASTGKYTYYSGTFFDTPNIVVYTNYTSWAQNAVIKSYDADGFTLTWTKIGTPTAGTLSLRIICYR